MSRVLVTGGATFLGAALVRRLLSDPTYEVRVADQRPAPQWMREGCEIHTTDLSDPEHALSATRGCTHVIHLAAGADASIDCERQPQTWLQIASATLAALIDAALEFEVERFTYISSSAALDRASEFPTTEAHLTDCPAARSAYGFSCLSGEVSCREAHAEHGLPFTICRPFGAYGPDDTPATRSGLRRAVLDLITQAHRGRRALGIPGSAQRRRTPTHVSDIAAGILTAIGSPAGLNEDFHISATRELTLEQIARSVWEACGRDREEFALEQLPDSSLAVPRRWPSVAKAGELLGWEAQVGVDEGIAATARWFSEQSRSRSSRAIGSQHQ